MLGKRTWIVAVVFFLILILVSVFTRNSTPTPYPPYLVESPAPTGLKGFYTYLNQNQYQVEDSESLPNKTSTGEVRFLLNPPIYSENSVEKHYQDYLKNGNTIILAKQNPDSLFGIETEYAMEAFFNEEDQTLEVTHQNQSFDVLHDSTHRIVLHEDDRVLLKDEFGVLAIERELGEGSLIVLTEPDWLTNGQITKEQHLDVLFTILPIQDMETVIFDEYGLTDSGGLVSPFALYPNWSYILLVQGIIATIFLLWHQGKRFGPITTVREETVRFSDERLKALAIWQLKGKNYQPSIKDQLDYLQEAIRQRYGIPYYKSWQDRLNSIEGKLTSMSAIELNQIAKGFETITEQQTLNKQEFLKWSGEIDKIREEVETN
ncbi:DUF4350 domain-containing protein [Gracilibacillus kekensis]|uniref:DUF4350 domain-containing protein n=1 Tax=Gracilibacillus kekensis TaxID=1027249 RepID=A0A1M7QJC5_9BACI|nr:DUF4350 domain-containing protein [Gracilibacillus kekensis]SHN31188.1 hypothetical protein SAMN05216179_3247 [Gracilibacillus kekensis]